MNSVYLKMLFNEDYLFFFISVIYIFHLNTHPKMIFIHAEKDKSRKLAEECDGKQERKKE